MSIKSSILGASAEEKRCNYLFFSFQKLTFLELLMRNLLIWLVFLAVLDGSNLCKHCGVPPAAFSIDKHEYQVS